VKVLGFTVLGGVVPLALLSATSREPENLGVTDGRLAPCPATPNCVCSQDEDAAHHVEPIHYEFGDPVPRLIAAVQGMSGARVVEATQTYVRAEFTSLLFRFVDDVEFLVDEEHHQIHVRSASRVGHSDLGVNRRRVEAVRRAFAAAGPPPGQAEDGGQVPRLPPPSTLPAAEQEAIRLVVETQLGAFACDDAETAFAQASPGIRKRYGSPEAFLLGVGRFYAPVYRQRDFRFAGLVEEHGVPVLRVLLRHESGAAVLALYAMEKQPDGAWRISGCSLVRP
jgi:uncharacterized protein (DUF1499 family)